MLNTSPSPVAISATHHRIIFFGLLFSSFVSVHTFSNPFEIFWHRSKQLLNYQKDEIEGNNNAPIMKAWTCHGRDQKDLVARMMQAGIVHTRGVQMVLEMVDRSDYIPKNPYMDSPQGIGSGQTISAPHMHAHVLEEIYPYLVGKTELKILDVGCGSGYLTAALGRFIQPKQGWKSPFADENAERHTGKVFGIDVRQDLVELSMDNIQKADRDLVDAGILSVREGDGWKGLPLEAPFDAIHVGAAADGMPYDLVSQLKVGGIMIIPIGAQTEIQSLCKIERVSSNQQDGFDAKDFRIMSLLGVRYVPLVRADSN